MSTCGGHRPSSSAYPRSAEAHARRAWAQTRQRRLRNEHSQALLALLDANAQIPAPVPLLLDSQEEEEEEEELWARRALHAYHDALADGYKPGLRLLERLMSCLRLPHQATILPSQHLVRLALRGRGRGWCEPGSPVAHGRLAVCEDWSQPCSWVEHRCSAACRSCGRLCLLWACLHTRPLLRGLTFCCWLWTGRLRGCELAGS